jgi:hypothetical protein
MLLKLILLLTDLSLKHEDLGFHFFLEVLNLCNSLISSVAQSPLLIKDVFSLGCLKDDLRSQIANLSVSLIDLLPLVKELSLRFFVISLPSRGFSFEGLPLLKLVFKFLSQMFDLCFQHIC